jgi:hypothetical protein
MLLRGELGGEMVVDRLQVHGAAVDTPALRLGLSHLLDDADAHPPGLSPAAILLVRRLADLPAQRLAPPGLPTRNSGPLSHAVRDRLGQLARQAARPVQGITPPNADAVLFADEGELLACLALDLSRGRALHCWWWQTILRLLGSVDLPVILRGEARLVPAVMAYLLGWDQAAPVVRAIAPAQAKGLLQAVLYAHQIQWTPPPADTPLIPADAEQVGPDFAARPDPGDRRVRSTHAGPRLAPTLPAAPWAEDEQLSTSLQQLSAEQRCLVGVAAMLHRRPRTVVSPLFLQSLSVWWQAAVENPPQVGSETGSTPHARPRRDPMGKAPLSTASTAEEITGPPEAPLADLADSPGQSIAGEVAGTEADPLPPGEEAGQAAAPATAPKSATPAAADASSLPEEALPPLSQPFSQGVSTRLGGLLYLLNLFDRLEILDAFEVAAQVGCWGLLDGVGRALLGSAADLWAHDPIWALLAQLDGRDPEARPGATLPAQDDFRLPAAWLHNVDRCRWNVVDGRLYLWTGDPFLLADVAGAGAEAASQAAREAGIYAAQPWPAPTEEPPLHVLASSWFATCSPGYRRWLRNITPYLHIWLARALQLEPDQPDALVETLFARPGRLYATSTHLDLVMSLEAISLPVRMAGLDRSPGWWPHLGRAVTFHFE